jgi:exoribonuclease-2
LLPIPELQVRVGEDKQITINVKQKETPSQVIVSECMILANSLAALLFQQQRFPALYRRQDEPREKVELEEDASIFNLLYQRKLLSRVEIGVEPGLHCSLGLSPYTSITSPLRKYLDLIMQRQLLCLLTGRAPMYRSSDLKQIAETTEPCLTRAAIVEQERTRYWILKFLKNQIKQTLEAVVTDKRSRGYSIHILDYLLDAQITPPKEINLEPGQQISVIIEDVNPFQGTLKVKLYSSEPAI